MKTKRDENERRGAAFKKSKLKKSIWRSFLVLSAKTFGSLIRLMHPLRFVSSLISITIGFGIVVFNFIFSLFSSLSFSVYLFVRFRAVATSFYPLVYSHDWLVHIYTQKC